MKNIITIFIRFTAMLVVSLTYVPNLSAQTYYTLQDDDVVVINGFIDTCTYDFELKNIIIPDVLDDQLVVGIRDKLLYDTNGIWIGGVFQGKQLKSVLLPKAVKYIGDFAFYSNSIESLKLCDYKELIHIGVAAFDNAYLDSVDLSGCISLVSIHDAAFTNGIKDIDFDGCTSLSFIGGYAFGSGCTFFLPTPLSTNFQYWIDDDGTQYQGGDQVSWISSYRAIMPPISIISANKRIGKGELNVRFFDASPGNPSSWLWDFGDGETSTEQNPIHLYDSIGSYDVTLTTSNEYGDDELSRKGFIQVYNSTSSIFQNNELSLLEIYPNPANDFTFVKGKVGDLIEIYALSGKLVKSQRMLNEIEQVNVGDLAKSIYMLRIGNQINKLFVE